MSVTIYRDNAASAIFIEDSNGAQFLNSLHATLGTLSGSCSVIDTARNIEIITALNYTEFIDDNGDAYGANETEVCNNLNAIFQTAGSTGNAPNITSSLAVSITTGDTLNYTLMADYGVGYEWDFSSVLGVVNVEGNPRKIIGGSNLTAGSYNIPVKAINYYGEDSQTIVLTVSNPPYNNTKSVFFRQNDYCELTANTANPLYRSGNNTGTAWSVAFWYKPSTSNNQNQTILSFGGNDLNNEGRIAIRYKGNNASRRQLSLFYGTNFNNLEFLTPVGSTSGNTWAHWLFIYDGGTTENGSGGISTSYSRFKIYKNGVLQTTTNSNSNFGFSGAINTEYFRFSRLTSSGQYSRNCNIDEMAIWSSDQSANIADIYNSGVTHDLAILSNPPQHYWRMGDGDTFPLLEDAIGSLNATMVNMTVADIVSDVP